MLMLYYQKDIASAVSILKLGLEMQVTAFNSFSTNEFPYSSAYSTSYVK